MINEEAHWSELLNLGKALQIGVFDVAAHDCEL